MKIFCRYGKSIVGFREDYEIKTLSYQEAMTVVVEKHYLHRKCPVSRAYGLFKISSGECVGVVTYGVSPSSTLLKGICGPEEAKNVYELNRLWMNDICPKNSESRFIGWALRELSKIKPALIIVSYADTEQNHSGIVYRSTNWIYTGQTKPVLEYQVKGIKMHSKTVSNSVPQSTDKKSKKQMHLYICFRIYRCKKVKGVLDHL